MAERRPEPNYKGVHAKLFPIDDTRNDNIWIAQCPPEAFVSFIADPAAWVKGLAEEEGGKPLNAELPIPFTIDIYGLNVAEAKQGGDVIVEGVNGTPAVTVRTTFQSSIKMLEFFDARHPKSNPVAVESAGGVGALTFDQFMLKAANLINYVTRVNKPGDPTDGEQKHMQVVEGPNGRVYAHFEVKDAMALNPEFTTLAALVLMISHVGSGGAAALMSQFKQDRQTMSGGRTADDDIPFSAARAEEEQLHVIYTSKGEFPMDTCLHAVSMMKKGHDGDVGAVPETIIFKDYPQGVIPPLPDGCMERIRRLFSG